jgi:O-antigen/teichoic acid export membrane protein
MQAPTDTVPGPRPILMRILVRSWEYRRPRLWVRVRLASGVFNVVIGVALIAASPWIGPLALLAALPLAGATLVFWTANRLQASVQS